MQYIFNLYSDWLTGLMHKNIKLHDFKIHISLTGTKMPLFVLKTNKNQRN